MQRDTTSYIPKLGGLYKYDIVRNGTTYIGFAIITKSHLRRGMRSKAEWVYFCPRLGDEPTLTVGWWLGSNDIVRIA